MSSDPPVAFVYQASPARVVFGEGALAKASEEIDRLGGRRVLILATSGRRELADQLARQLGAKAVGIFDRAVMHVPAETAEAGRVEAARVGADAYLSIGGGSATGLAKAIAAVTGHPTLSIATTYSGSEMTATWGLTEHGVKKTMRDPRVQPRTVIYDPALTLSLPARLSATSGMNAMAHCVEALYAKDANPVISLIAEEGIGALARGLPAVVRSPADHRARSLALYGAWLGGVSLGGTTTALHHKLCHVLGGAFDLPHSDTHTILLPHVTAYNAAGAPRAIQRIARVLGAQSAARGLWDLEVRMGAPLTLESIGMKRQGIEQAVKLAMERPFDNPSPLVAERIHALLEDAFEGRPPRE